MGRLLLDGGAVEKERLKEDLMKEDGSREPLASYRGKTGDTGG